MADQKDTYKQLPAEGDYKVLPAATLKDPESGVLRCLVPQTQLFEATAAVLRYNAVSRVTGTVAARWLKIPRLGFLDEFGMLAKESAMQDALWAFTPPGDILSFQRKVVKLE